MAGYLSSCTLFLRRCSKYANSRFLYNIKSREVATRAIVKGNATEAYSLLWTSPILCVRVKRMSFTNVLFRPTTQDSVLCWKCGDMINLNQDLFCNSCEVVQKPSDDVNYFEILSVEKQFDLDAKELTKKFRLLQMQLHPDRFTQKSEDEKTISSSYSSMLNQAYKTLQSPLARGLYLLELEGYAIGERDNHVEPEFLFEIMELNEELDEIENSEDLFQMSDKNQGKLDHLLKEISNDFQRKDWEKARYHLIRLKYYTNIQEKIKELEQRFREENN